MRGYFSKLVEIENRYADEDAKLVIFGRATRLDVIILKEIYFGDFTLQTDIIEESKHFLNCTGPITSSVYFGESGVGKSTVASLVSSNSRLITFQSVLYSRK